MAEQSLQIVVELFRGYVEQQNWSIIEEKGVQNGLQLLITDGKVRTPVVCFSNGNALIQGPSHSLKTQLQTWWSQRKTAPLVYQQETIPSFPQLQNKVDAFLAYAQEQGWAWAGKALPQGDYQLRLTPDTTTIPIHFYSTGTVLIQGPSGPLKQRIEQWWHQQSQATMTPLWESNPISEGQAPEKALQRTTLPPSPKLVAAHIGTDEAGKGDYFGPLVVAGVYLDEQQATQLRSLGVRDSKTLSDTAIVALADEIKHLCPPQHVTVLSYQPAHYNRLYSEVQNLNQLLAKAHAHIIQTLQQATGCQFALVDQFGPEALMQQALQALHCQITLEQRPRAEEDVAVAAASILARAEFVAQFARLAKYAQMELPKGASNPAIVVIGRDLVARFGQDMLRRLAKLHFQTTQAILQKDDPGLSL